MRCLGTNAVVTRDQFTIVPMTKELVDHITRIANQQGLTRGNDPGAVDHQRHAHDDTDPDLPILPPADHVPLPLVIPPSPTATDPTGLGVTATTDGTLDDNAADGTETPEGLPDEPIEDLRRSRRIAGLAPEDAGVFKISVRDALQQRPNEAKQVIEAELRQMLDKGVWTPVHVHQLDDKARRTIIRSSMFLKDKFLATGDHEKLKARLVAGGDQQDKTLYDDLSSPTAATSSVLIVAALAASEGRHVCATDIGGAFLNANMADTGVTVHMRLRKELASILCAMDATYHDYVEPSGSVVVRLRRALYGCVEAAKLWHDTLIAELKAMGFRRNSRDECVLNRSQGGMPHRPARRRPAHHEHGPRPNHRGDKRPAGTLQGSEDIMGPAAQLRRHDARLRHARRGGGNNGELKRRPAQRAHTSRKANASVVRAVRDKA